VDKSRTKVIAALAGIAAAGLLLSGCGFGNAAAGSPFVPKKPGVLTVATSFLPAPGFWYGPHAKDGFEAGLARALAVKLGLKSVRVVQVPFARLTTGHLDGADIGLSQVTPTPERAKTADFSTQYLFAPPGVLVRTGVQAIDLQGLRGLRWVIARVSTLTPIVENTVRPTTPPVVVEDRAKALDVLQAGNADALLVDLPVALGLARADPGEFHVLGQLSGGESLAAVLPKGSPNLTIVDSEIRALTANGILDNLAAKWLGSQANVPLIRTSQ
jgi:polar amino acid transport system substrate-binding protein